MYHALVLWNAPDKMGIAAQQCDKTSRFGGAENAAIAGKKDMSDTRRYIEGTFTEHGQHAQVLYLILDEDTTLSHRFRHRWIDNQLGGCFVCDRNQWDAPTISLALEM